MDYYIELLDDTRIEFTEREIGLIFNCMDYAGKKPSGLPGHNLMIIINKLVMVSRLMDRIEPIPRSYPKDGLT